LELNSLNFPKNLNLVKIRTIYLISIPNNVVLLKKGEIEYVKNN